MEPRMIALAVDVGGTKVAAAAIDQDGTILRKTHAPTDLSGPHAVLEQILTMSRALFDGDKPAAAGICVPAVLEHETDRVLWAPNLPGWEDADLKTMIGERLGITASVEYDGHAAVLGEWWAGEGHGYTSIASIIIGTGIGGGFIVDGQLWRGRDRLAGAIGWFPIHTPDGTVHWEAAAAGPAIARRALRLMADGLPTQLSADGLTAKTVFDAARNGDDIACRVIEETAEYIGYGVAAVISFANPQIVILGGSIGLNAELILPAVERIAAQWSQPYSARKLPIVCTRLGEEAGLLGAAYSAFQAVAS
jgi:glucokinase